MQEDIETAIELLKNRRLAVWCLKESELLCQDGISWNVAVENQTPPEKLKTTIEYQRDHWQPILRNAMADKLPEFTEFGKKLDWHYYPLEGVIGHIMGNAYGRMRNNLKKIFLDIPYDIDPISWTIKNVSDEEFSQHISVFLEAKHEEARKECEKRPQDVGLHKRK